MDAPRWWALVLIAVALVPHIAIGIDRWVHRQANDTASHTGRIDRLEQDWRRLSNKQSDLSGEWQTKILAVGEQIHEIRRQLERIEAHLEYIDRQRGHST